ncbi:MAG: hypothetical protein M1827_007246, partial [Pycnora praestabilis]
MVLVLSEKYAEFADVFDMNKKSALSEQTAQDHAINLIAAKKLSFRFLYNMFSLELNMLRKYLIKNLEAETIQEFTSSAESSIMFKSKKN